MAIPSPTAIFVALILFYISSFVFFAIVRIATGVSIQRIGYFSLRRIAYSPREGVHLSIRGLGLSLHRFSFAQPSYISLRFQELKVTVDPKVLAAAKSELRTDPDGVSTPQSDEGKGGPFEECHTPISSHAGPGSTGAGSKGKGWKVLLQLKDRLKKLHKQIHWFSLVDISALNTTVRIVDACDLHIGTISLAVDTRRNTMDSGNLFRHKKDPRSDQQPAEWMLNVRNVLLALEGCEPKEIVDNFDLNIHGLIHKDCDGLEDVSVALKVGRLHFPYDDVRTLLRKTKGFSPEVDVENEPTNEKYLQIDDSPLENISEEPESLPPKAHASNSHESTETREFILSLVHGIQEIQIALSFFRLSCSVGQSPTTKKPLYLNVVTHEVGVDFHRMDPTHPAHRMYFQRDQTAHQALLAAISTSVSLDESIDEHDKLLYIPMATTTIKTTLPSKSVSILERHDADECNTNVVFANFVITSPSVDIASRHVSQILALLRARRSGARDHPKGKRLLISQLLPKASMKLSVHEPVLRFVLPVADAKEDYNLLVSSISSISLDIESSHSMEEGAQYSVASTYRVASHLLYYQTAAGVRHRLLATESMELKVYMKASPEWTVAISGVLNEFSVHLVSAEVTRGVHQVVEQIRDRIPAPQALPQPHKHQSFLRRLPTWLFQFQFETSGFSIEVAGTDETVGSATRGMVLQLGGWSADYQLQKVRPNARSMRRRTPSHSAASDDPSFRFAPTSPPGKSYTGPADGRRLALHVRGLEGFVIESADFMEPESFLSIPRLEVAFSTSSDLQGPIFHINSAIHEIYLKHSLYRYYAVGIAAFTLKDAFYLPPKETTHPGDWPSIPRASINNIKPTPTKPELTTFDIKMQTMRVECAMPRDPAMLIQVYGLAAGRHRWSAPFLRCHLIRLHVEPPRLKGFWARIVSVTGIRAGLRESRSKPAETITPSTSFDISTEFIRLAVPHHMVMHSVFDNFVNTIKSIEQLNHRLKTRSSSFTFEKPPSGPKHVPKICLRSKSVLFELEDDSFEWKLGCIYRLGLREQKQRLAREEAFFAKKRKIEECERRNANIRLRNRSAQAQRSTGGRLRKHDAKRRSVSVDSRPRARSRSRNEKDPLKPRYDPCDAPEFTDSCKVDPEDAWVKLQANNARSWKSIIDESVRYQNKAIRDIRSIFAGADVPPEGLDDDHGILPMPNRPGLLSARIMDFNLTIDAPSFPIHEYPLYLNKIGKGMPLDMKYSLLIPMSIRLEMGELRANLRDYPLDLLHIPPMGMGQSPRLPSCTMKTDFVIAEEYRNFKSSRHVLVSIVPAGQSAGGAENEGFSIQVRRTVSPVKTYSNPTLEINSNLPTTISWGMSYQPVIQDMMKIFENFSKPEIDPSERVGFWDKIRLSFHSQINVLWKGDGNVHLQLKGSRDPYVVTGFGAGFMMCWRKDVQLEINTKGDPKELMTVTSGDYVLAVPDYSHQARYSYESPFDNDTSSSRSDRDLALFKKVIMKLSGNVRWLAGLVFERNPDGRGRCFDFKPHYDVVLRNPKFLDTEHLEGYDAFRGFRSNHIHLSVAVVAPVSREWSFSNREPSTSYNTVHLTPRFFTHFFSWWSLFSGVMSLPVRQGPLWPGLTKTSKKFGRHLGTVKYNLFLSPLFVAHIYKHKDVEEYSEDTVFATGLKARLDSLMLDLHQRREQVSTLVKGRSKQTKASVMRINRAQLDFIAADVRAVSSSIGGTNPADIEGDKDDIISSFQQPPPPPDFSRFTIPDDDLNWIDMDDFVEMDWILPAESNPKTLILPLAYSPRFSYFRQTDHQELSPEETGYSQFGDEPTHFCVMSQDNDPRRVQIDLIKERLELLYAQISSHERLRGEHEQKMTENGSVDEDGQSQYESFTKQGDSLRERQDFLRSELRRLEIQLFGKSSMVGCDSQNGQTDAQSSTHSQGNVDGDSTEDEYASDFDNRFVIHNVQLKWNNSLRNIILRYIHQVGQRRGYVYYMSRRAVKFILDIVEEQSKSKTKRSVPRSGRQFDQNEADSDDDISVEDRIEQLLNDANRCVNADDATPPEGKEDSALPNGSKKIAPDFTPQNSYYLRLIAPQIQLQSEKNKKSVALVTAKGMQLKVISIMDKRRVFDDVSGLVQRRFNLDMDSAQFFVTTQKTFSSHIHIYCGNRYGNTPGSAWPPWVSLESMFDFEVDLSGFSRIIHRTSASLKYDKYNTLRLKYNEEVGKGDDDQHSCPVPNENRMDQISVEFPQVRAICDSTEYYSMYIIVLDLLLYSEPLEQIRSERLEKIMLASDFSDLRGAPEMVNRLQERIRQLQEIKSLFLIQAAYLDRQGWEDRMALEQDLATCEDELFFIMKAITTSQRRTEDLSKSNSSGLLRWMLSASEIVFHLMTEHRQPLAEFQLRNAAYERTDHTDGSNHNAIEVENLHGLNLLSNAIYPQVITPYLDNQRHSPPAKQAKILKVKWRMLEAIAGIPVLDNFEVALFPLKIQLERELGKKLFEYVFPGVGANAFENGGFSPFMIKQIDPTGDDDDEEDETTSGTPTSIASTKSHTGEDVMSQSHLKAIEKRLMPTTTLPEKHRSRSPVKSSPNLTQSNRDFVRYKRAAANERGRSPTRPTTSRLPVKKGSIDNLRMIKKQHSDLSLRSQNGNGAEDKNKKFGLQRQPTRLMTKDETDDLSQMISRSSNYMILTHVKINDVVLCLSYKGRGERNIEDIHDFVFRLPVLEYRNKTWSNLDLALRLKKDAIKALISHTPAILGNKFSHHRPTKQQQKRLRELASSAQVLSVPDGQYNSGVSPSDGSNSIISHSSTDRSESPGLSFLSNETPNYPPRSAGSAPNSIHSEARSTRSATTDELDDDTKSYESSTRRPRTAGQAASVYSQNADSASDRPKRRGITFLGRKLMGS